MTGDAVFEGFDTADVRHVEIEEYLVGPGELAQLDGVVLAVYRNGVDEAEIVEFLFEEGTGPALATIRRMVEKLNAALSRRGSSGSKTSEP